MKNILPCFLLSFVLLACTAAQEAPRDPNTIVVSGTSVYTGAVGYGNIYACALTKNPYGHLQDTLSLVFLAGDQMEDKIKPNTLQTFRFKKEQEKVPYHLMPLTGFVDEKMTSWKLTAIE